MPDTEPCPTCSKPMLPGYPHNHYTQPRVDFNPMPPRPPSLSQMVGYLRMLYLEEIPDRLHVAHVPSHTAPVPVDMADPDGPSVMVVDAGPLGGPPFAPAFAKRIGAVVAWQGEIVLRDTDLEPAARALEGVRRWCAGRHRTWYEHDGRPLCWLLLRHVTFGGYTVAGAAALEDVADAGELLAGAVDRWWRYTDAEVNGLRVRRSKNAAA